MPTKVTSEEAKNVLFMHYLDQVFYMQFPFYHNQCRGWLYSILRRSKSAYYASLALSEQHLASKTGKAKSPVEQKDKNGYHALAVEKMKLSLSESHLWSGTEGLTKSIETLTCILQLIFWEVRYLSIKLTAYICTDFYTHRYIATPQ